MTTNRYALGQGVKLTFAFADSDGEPNDPSAVTVTVLAPDLTETAYSLADLTRVSVGSYSLEVVLSQPGYWYYRTVSTGALDCAAESYVIAQKSFVLDNA